MKKNSTKAKAEANSISITIPKNEQLLKVGDQVLCVTMYSVDKATVEKVDKDTKVALLSNQTKLSAIVNSGGTLTRIGDTKINSSYKLWSDSVEDEYQYRLAKQGIKLLLNSITSSVDDIAKVDLVTIYKKLKKITIKYNLNVK